jgi:hypothetical protein
LNNLASALEPAALHEVHRLVGLKSLEDFDQGNVALVANHDIHKLFTKCLPVRRLGVCFGVSLLTIDNMRGITCFPQ